MPPKAAKSAGETVASPVLGTPIEVGVGVLGELGAGVLGVEG